MNRDGRREGDEGAAQKETAGKTRTRRKEGTVPRTATSRADLEQATKRQGYLGAITPGATERGRQAAQRARAGATEEERARRQQGRKVRSGDGGGPPVQKRPRNRNPGQEQSGRRGAQPQDRIRGPGEEGWQRRATAEVVAGLRPKEGREEGRGWWRGRAKTQRVRHGRQKEAGVERSIRRSSEVRTRLRSTQAARRPVTRTVVVGPIPISSARGANLKTSIVQGSW